MLNWLLCLACWFVCSIAALPLTWVAWTETTNTCTGKNPIVFLWAIANLLWAIVYGRQLFRPRPIQKMAAIWTVSTIYYLLPFVFIVASSGLSGLSDAYAGFTRYFTRDLSQNPAELAFKMYAFVWLPFAGILSLSFALYSAAERTILCAQSLNLTHEHWKYHWVLPCIMATIGSVSARHSIWWSDFVTLERGTARNLAQSMRFHSLINSNEVITNLTQLSATTNPQYFSYLQQRFARYGRYAGFESSISEKFTFISPTFTTRRGELILVSSAPYPNREGKYERSLILKTGPEIDSYRADSLEERFVQAIFKEAGRSLQTRPPPSPLKMTGVPLHIRMTELIGLGPEWAAEICLVLFSAAVVGLWRLLTSLDRLRPPAPPLRY